MSYPRQLETMARRSVECGRCFECGKLKRSFVDLPQPRYVGPRYWSAALRTAFVMINPGAGVADWRNDEWKGHLHRFRTGDESLGDVFTAQRRHMPNWVGNKLIPFLELHGLDVECIALVNIAWCATEENKYPKWMLKQCFASHTQGWLTTLAPKVVILSGTASHAFERNVHLLLPGCSMFKTFHYAHRPLDAERARRHALEVAGELANINPASA